MAKVVIVVESTQVVIGNVFISYSASIIGTSNISYGADYQVNTGISVVANITAWRSKIIAEVLIKGSVIIDTDIIIFGSPV
jgi:hypothetical protein